MALSEENLDCVFVQTHTFLWKGTPPPPVFSLLVTIPANVIDAAPTAEGGDAAADGENKEGETGGERRRDRREEEPREEEPPTFTLAEWKAQQEKRSEPKFNIRKAGQDVDPKWKKAFAYKKEKETAEEEDDEVIELIICRK